MVFKTDVEVVMLLILLHHSYLIMITLVWMLRLLPKLLSVICLMFFCLLFHDEAVMDFIMRFDHVDDYDDDHTVVDVAVYVCLMLFSLCLLMINSMLMKLFVVFCLQSFWLWR